jgi:molecular chaperone DnaJ
LELDTLDGREEIIIRPGTQPGEKIVLRSRGVVELNGYRRGDYIININIKIPTRLDNEEISLLKRYAKGREEAVGDGTSSFFSSIKNAFKR